jgi:hypothetical protein
VQICAADARRPHSKQHLARARFADLLLLKAQIVISMPNPSFSAHSQPLRQLSTAVDRVFRFTL